ncbi:GyrI-like domain-containing protein [Leptospira kanakyensis]|uniref:GyrI-like domain-containing protein n=1 Tax=Leptospira kanakyensis TaxID=2484968 RepID=A0A6N4PYL9_9LEPT|nr:effector binding domain-containing protein [Leptospira kanakyensis]MCW7480243.1 effector binding domain-containing protein [Leptospira kanakyensis]TGK50444.1 GyrI-like domain-containing protein [Leptospira kanakyensis]TGK63954.1 GyrI-like domain-containing protein [Leptospira kanakyensis]TGK69582.1 GyrI-like domain-containing protein [Leptospira kanakyensis]
MDSEIISIEKKYLVGKKIEMSLSQSLTPTLWKSFVPSISSIQNRVSKEMISLSVYPIDYFQNFNLNRSFVKWAGVEVSSLTNLPEGLEVLEIPAGFYSVFPYKGLASEAGPFFQWIFREWFPNSEYDLDNRPHFEVLGEKYKNDDPSSEELVYIPIKPR